VAWQREFRLKVSYMSYTRPVPISGIGKATAAQELPAPPRNGGPE